MDFIDDNDSIEENNIEVPFEKNKEISFVDKIINEKKTSIASKNKILDEEEELVRKYCIDSERQNLYYLAGISSKNPNNVVLYSVQDNELEIIKINKNELPEDYYINCILYFENETYHKDEIASYEIIEKIKSMIISILDEQKQELKQYRKEEHLYRVEEDVNSRIYLWDMTDKPDYTIEEVDFPDDLLQYAKEGAIFKYINGIYIRNSD